jgi:hypothetical protein
VDSNDDESETNENEDVDDSDDDRTIWSFAKTKAVCVFLIAVVSLVAWVPNGTGKVENYVYLLLDLINIVLHLKGMFSCSSSTLSHNVSCMLSCSSLTLSHNVS